MNSLMDINSKREKGLFCFFYVFFSMAYFFPCATYGEAVAAERNAIEKKVKKSYKKVFLGALGVLIGGMVYKERALLFQSSGQMIEEDLPTGNKSIPVSSEDFLSKEEMPEENVLLVEEAYKEKLHRPKMKNILKQKFTKKI